MFVVFLPLFQRIVCLYGFALASQAFPSGFLLHPRVSSVVRWLFFHSRVKSIWISQCLTESIRKKKRQFFWFVFSLCQRTDEDILRKKKRLLKWYLKMELMLRKKQQVAILDYKNSKKRWGGGTLLIWPECLIRKEKRWGWEPQSLLDVENCALKGRKSQGPWMSGSLTSFFWFW